MVRFKKRDEQSFEIQHQHKVTHCSSAADNIPRVLGDITNCTIGNISIKVNPTFTVHCSIIEKEFDSDVTLEY